MSSKVAATPLSPFELFSTGSRSKAPAAAAAPEEVLITKPTLNLNPIRRYLSVNAKASDVGQTIMESNMREVEEQRTVLEALRAEQVQRLQASLKTRDFSGFWGILAKIGSFVLSALSAVLGFALVGTGAGTIVGGAMIASGVLSIANLALEETGGWDYIIDKLVAEDEDLRRKVRILLPTAIGALSGIVGLGGAIFGWGMLNAAGKLVTIVQTAANLAAAVTMGAKGVHLARVAAAEAEHVRINHQVFEKEDHLDELVNRFMFSQKQIRKEIDNASRIITLQSR